MRLKMKTVQQNNGFSLLEVLVAFSITAMAVTVIMQIYAKGTTSAILGEDYAQASLIAESKLTSLQLEEDLDDAVLSGVELDKYNWEIVLEDFIDENPAESPLIAIKEVTLTVKWESRGQERRLHLQTLRPNTLL
jgi:general secretion pathway protein I